MSNSPKDTLKRVLAMTTRVLLLFAALLTSAIVSPVANACSYMFEDPNGRRYDVYYEFWPRAYSNNIFDENDFIAVIETGLVEETKIKLQHSREEDALLLSHRIIKPIYGEMPQLEDVAYPPPNFPHTEEQDIEFHHWESLDFPSPDSMIGANLDSCGHGKPRVALEPDSTYIVFGHKFDYYNYIFDAIYIESLSSPLVSTFSQLAKDKSKYPLQMTPAEYFGHMDGYIEIEMLDCPADIENAYKFLDSRYSTAEKQKDKLYKVVDSYPYKSPSFDYRRGFNIRADCQIGDRYLILTSKYMKVLPIKNGQISTEDIITNIDIKSAGPLRIDKVKSWMHESSKQNP